MRRAIKVFAILLGLSGFLFASELKACYKAYLLYLPVAQTCITYRLEGKNLQVSSFARTINVGKVVKRVYNRGSATIGLPELEPRYFSYYQEEGDFKRYQEYRFEEGKIKVLEIKYVELTDQIEKREEKEYKYRGFVDPYTASLMLYKESAKTGKGTIKMFYDDKEYWIPYSVVGKERVETPAGYFFARKLEVYPNVETKGLLKPKGKWYLWIDEESNIPVRMDLKFAIGSASAKLEKIEGDRYLLKSLFAIKK